MDVEEETDNNNNNDDVNDEDVDNKIDPEKDDNEEAEQEKWYYKAKFILDRVTKFLRTYCVHPGFAIIINDMI